MSSTAADDVIGPCMNSVKLERCITSARVNPVILQNPSEQKMMWNVSDWAFATRKLRSRNEKNAKCFRFSFRQSSRGLASVCLFVWSHQTRENVRKSEGEKNAQTYWHWESLGLIVSLNTSAERERDATKMSVHTDVSFHVIYVLCLFLEKMFVPK